MNPRHLLLLLVIAGALFFWRLGQLPLTEPDEGRNAEVAREMLALHDAVTPHYDTLPYLDKPAFFFWLVAGSFRLFGVSEWPARLPSALAALGTLLLVWLMGRRMFGESAGLVAGVIFATAPLVMVFARLVIFDMTLTFLVTLALAAFWLTHGTDGAMEGGRRRSLEYLVFVAAGAASITKGPVGFVLPLLAIGVYAAVQRNLGALKRLAWAPGLAVFLAVSLPWFLLVSRRNPDFPRYAFWDETLLRFSTGHGMHRGGSVFYYIPVFLLGFLPWSFTLLFAAVNRLKAWRRLRDESRAAEAFLLSWAATVFVFFSISHSKLPAYFLPALPPLAVLMGRIWSDDVGRDPARPRPDWLTAGFAALIALGLLLAATPAWLKLSSLEKLASQKIHPAVLQSLPSSIFYSGLILAALGVLGRNLAARTTARAYAARCLAVLALAVPLLGLRCWPVLRVWAATASSQRLARALQRGPDRDRPVYGYFYFRTSLPFYLGRPVGLVTTGGEELTSNYLAARWPSIESRAAGGSATGGPLFMTGSEFTALGRSPSTSFLVLVRNNEVGDITKLESFLEPLWQAWEYSVWRISNRGSALPDQGEVPTIIEGVIDGVGLAHYK